MGRMLEQRFLDPVQFVFPVVPDPDQVEAHAARLAELHRRGQAALWPRPVLAIKGPGDSYFPIPCNAFEVRSRLIAAVCRLNETEEASARVRALLVMRQLPPALKLHPQTVGLVTFDTFVTALTSAVTSSDAPDEQTCCEQLLAKMHSVRLL